MRKMSKILFMLALILMLIFSYTSISKAADQVDRTGYEELAEELGDETDNKEEPAKTPSTETPKTTTETKQDISNKATEPHIQAGSFEVVSIATSGAILLAVAGIGYVKYKKYNY